VRRLKSGGLFLWVSMMMKALVITTAILVPHLSKASEVKEQYGNVRSLGMGGVYMSIVKDANAVFYNPAALYKIQGFEWQVMDIEAGVNGIDVYNQFKDIQLSTPASYNSLYGKHIWLRAGGSMAMGIPNFAIGAFSNSHAQLELHNPAFPQFATEFNSDYGMVVGGAFPIGPFGHGGLTLKKITRWGGAKDLDLGTIAGGQVSNIANQFQDKGNGYGVDLAAMTTLPVPFSPTFSVTWQDIGSTAFNMTAGTQAPERTHDNLSIGVSTLADLPGLDWTTALEYRHITESEYQLAQKLHLGTEVSLPLIDLRAGISQGYASYGVGVNFLFLSFDVASYTEERGAYAGQTPENRIQLGLSIDLGFDADFGLTDSNGKKRKLKQRR
jgi:hypothetical protein